MGGEVFDLMAERGSDMAAERQTCEQEEGCLLVTVVFPPLPV